MADLTEIQAAQSVKIIGTDSTGLETNPVNATVNGLKVDGSAVTQPVDLVGLNAIQTSQYTVGTSAVQLTPSPLSTRSSISIRVKTSSNTEAVYIGATNAVTTSTGYLLLNNDSIQIDITPSGTIWAIGSSAGQTVYVLELGS